MSLFLLAKSGPSKGKKWALKDGHLIGRKGVPISLGDPKVSREHAKVIVNDRGQFQLEDLKSKSGLFVDGNKVRRVLLTPNMVIQVGETVLEVLEEEEPTVTGISAQDGKKAERNAGSGESPPHIEVPPPEWHEYLEGFVAAKAPGLKSKKEKLASFLPPIELRVFRGVQMDTTWTLGYGPRMAGSHSVDLTLHDLGAPKHSFTIEPTNKGPRFDTPHPKQVRLNERSTNSEILKDGDVISVGDTCIEVRLSNESNR